MTPLYREGYHPVFATFLGVVAGGSFGFVVTLAVTQSVVAASRQPGAAEWGNVGGYIVLVVGTFLVAVVGGAILGGSLARRHHARLCGEEEDGGWP